MMIENPMVLQTQHERDEERRAACFEASISSERLAFARSLAVEDVADCLYDVDFDTLKKALLGRGAAAVGTLLTDAVHAYLDRMAERAAENGE